MLKKQNDDQDTSVSDIIISPSAVDILTNEGSVSEDEGGTIDIWMKV